MWKKGKTKIGTISDSDSLRCLANLSILHNLSQPFTPHDLYNAHIYSDIRCYLLRRLRNIMNTDIIFCPSNVRQMKNNMYLCRHKIIHFLLLWSV